MRHPSLRPLSQDHHHGLALGMRCRKQALGRLKPVGSQGLRLRVLEFREFFYKQLIRHFQAEEEILFPFMRKIVPQSAALLDDLIREHDAFRQAVESLTAEVALSKRIFDIGDLLERHIRREERELFPLFEKYVDGDSARALGEDIKRVLAGGENS